MGTVLGIEPYKVIAAAVVIGLAAVFITIIVAGPSTILDGAFSLLSQSVATASVAMTSLVASAGGIVTQGLGVAANAVAQTTMIAGQAVSGVIGVAGSVLDVAGAGVQAAAQLQKAALDAGSQIVTAAASTAVNIIQQSGIAIASLWFTVKEVQIFIAQVYYQNLAIAISQFTQVAFNAITQTFTTLFTSLAAAAGQLISIPMIMVYGYVAIGATMVQVVPGLISAVLSVFTSLFKKITDMFTIEFIQKIGDIPIKIGESIIDGFQNIVSNLGDQLKDVFIP